MNAIFEIFVKWWRNFPSQFRRFFFFNNSTLFFRLKFEEPLQPTRRKLQNSPKSAPPKVLMGPPTGASTPKTTAANRFKAHYLANQTPCFSPKKRLDFDSHDTSSNFDSSPRLRRTPYDLERQHTPSSSRGDQNSSYTHEADVSTNLSSATIKPVSLASKFDCFSDSD